MHVRVTDEDLTTFVEKRDHSVAFSHLDVQLRMLQEQLLIAKKGRRDRVVSMLEMLLLLIGGEKAPTQQACRLFGVSLVVLLDLLNEVFIFLALSVHESQSLADNVPCHISAHVFYYL